MEYKYCNFKEEIKKWMSLVYNRDCLQCPATCIGEIKQYFRNKEKQHQYPVKNKDKDTNRTELIILISRSHRQSVGSLCRGIYNFWD